MRILFSAKIMNKRRSKVFRSGTGLVLLIPKDWVRGMEIAAGDELELFYDGELRARKPPSETEESETPRRKR